jgi:hypothetical protein
VTQTYDCRICGIQDLQRPHAGSVDCINFYRGWVTHLFAQIEEVKAQLPPGHQLLGMPLSRTARMSLWLDGPMTPRAFEHLTKGIELLRDVFDEEEADVAVGATTPGVSEEVQAASV